MFDLQVAAAEGEVILKVEDRRGDSTEGKNMGWIDWADDDIVGKMRCSETGHH